MQEVEVDIRPSRRRTRTVSAHWSGTTTVVVLVPATMKRSEQVRWAHKLRDQLVSEREKSTSGDTFLVERTEYLNQTFFNGQAEPSSVVWVSNQNSRWASASPASRKIRVSHRLQGVPTWVLDAVLAHELAHLVVADHSPAFHALLEGVPRLLEAEAFLEGVAWSERRSS